MISVIKLLDRYEILYPDNEKIPLLRRSVFEKDFGSIFKLLGEDYEDLRKAVMEKNMHSIFRLLGEEYTELRKAVIQNNIWSIFRLAEDGISPSEQWTERQIHLRKAICNDNPWSIFRLTDQEDLRKAVLLQDMWSVFRILDEWQPTQFTKALKGMMVDGQEYDLDCMSRGQLRSKKWLVDQLAKLDRDLGTVFLCCGWYATLATMLFESNIKLDKIRSFDIDKSVAPIAERFNMPWLQDNWRFKALTKDIMHVGYNKHFWQAWSNSTNKMSEPFEDSPNTIINTSCEHLANFDAWYNIIPEGKLVVLQSNNFEDIEEHVNCSNSLEEFSSKIPMSQILYEGKLELEPYTRYMKIGLK
jgi:hypothetical protein